MKQLIVLLAGVMLSMPLSAKAVKPLIPLLQSFDEKAEKKEIEQMNRLAETERHLVETGSKNNINYRFFYSDGSGTFAGDKENDISYLRTNSSNWSLRCYRDVMSDEVSCNAKKEDFFVYYSKKTGYLVDLVGDKYPQSNISVRVDGGEVFIAPENRGFNKKQSSEILGLIQEGSMVATRYVDWPYRSNVDGLSAYYGLPVVLDYMKWVVEVAQ